MSAGRRSRPLEQQRGALGGDYWALAAYLAVPALVLLVLAASLPSEPHPAAPASHDAAVRELVRQRTLDLQEWPRLLAQLCRDPELLAVSLAPSCSDGTITLSDADSFDPEQRRLRPEAKQRLRIAMPILLDALRADERIWSQLDAIEIRGHADPRALHDPYLTNLHFSRERALAVLLFLTTDEEVPQQDRLDLQRLGLSSGASYSRPPADCRARTPECDSRAKRVEIRFELDSQQLRTELGDFYDQITRTLDR